MAVFKLVFPVTVLLEAENAHEARLRVSHLTLEELAEEMDEGEMIGSFTLTTETPVSEVKGQDLEDELLLIGNDGWDLRDEDFPKVQRVARVLDAEAYLGRTNVGLDEQALYAGCYTIDPPEGVEL
jgi:hypothetical protein